MWMNVTIIIFKLHFQHLKKETQTDCFRQQILMASEHYYFLLSVLEVNLLTPLTRKMTKIYK